MPFIRSISLSSLFKTSSLIYRKHEKLRFVPNSIKLKNLFSSLVHANGAVKLVITLPARKEKCEFSLKLLNENVSSLIENIKSEDKSIEKVVLYTSDGNRISQSTPLGLLVINPFSIKINDQKVHIEPPESLLKTSDTNLQDLANQELEQIRQLVSKLYLHLNMEQYEAEKEQKILTEMEKLKVELAPMEKLRLELEQKAKRHTNRMIWLGLGLMSIQAGVLARLTWFDYSWDIVEPISYFVSYSAVIGVYAYYVLTRKEYGYETASDRIYLRHFHKNAIRSDLNIKKYNQLKDSLYFLENDLKKIKESSLQQNEK
ncbi:unnamed protein product [Brachionus calyciflorus]|uniref:Calcium uniporter protein n=1 Tax=Brachionus calyciflorus TaxID=104777 RepID=A0A814DP56_9BILA|nr:unnamed protein product [Brachionus calyciflorus]